MNYRDPEEVMKAFGISEPVERLVFVTAALSHYEAICKGSMSESECEALAKASVEFAKAQVEALRK